MNRYEFECAVYASELDKESKAILINYAFHKNWSKGGKVWTNSKTIATETGLGEATIKRRVPVLRELGWLKYQGDTKASGGRPSKIYDLSIPVMLNSPQTLVSDSDPLVSPSQDFSITQSQLSYQGDTLISKEQDSEQVKEQEEEKSKVNEEEKHSPSGRAPAAPVAKDDSSSLESLKGSVEDNASSCMDTTPLEENETALESFEEDNESSFVDSTSLASTEMDSESSLDTEVSVLDIQSSLKRLGDEETAVIHSAKGPVRVSKKALELSW